jgi:hypothetical protein
LNYQGRSLAGVSFAILVVVRQSLTENSGIPVSEPDSTTRDRFQCVFFPNAGRTNTELAEHNAREQATERAASEVAHKRDKVAAELRDDSSRASVGGGPYVIEAEYPLAA